MPRKPKLSRGAWFSRPKPNRFGVKNRGPLFRANSKPLKAGEFTSQAETPRAPKFPNSAPSASSAVNPKLSTLNPRLLALHLTMRKMQKSSTKVTPRDTRPPRFPASAADAAGQKLGLLAFRSGTPHGAPNVQKYPAPTAAARGFPRGPAPGPVVNLGKTLRGGANSPRNAPASPLPPPVLGPLWGNGRTTSSSEHRR